MNEEEILTSESPGEEAPATEEAAEAKAESHDIMQELAVLGQKVAAAIQQIWDSEERKKAEAEIRNALHAAGERIDKISEEVQSSQVTEEIKEQAEKLKEAVEESSITQEVRRSLLLGLRKLNEELSKLVEKSEAKPAEPAPAAEEVAETKEE